MIAYLIRRLLYAVPIVLGVVLINFALFFLVNTPQDMARSMLKERATDEKVAEWVRAHGYDLPAFYNPHKAGLEKFTATLFYQKAARVVIGDLGRSDATDRDISTEIRRRMVPSLAIAVPTFFLGLAVNITAALIIAFCRGTYLDRWGTVVCVLMMSISVLFYIVAGQFVFARWLRLFPISGFDWGGSTAKFVFLPVVIGVVRGIGGGVRYYRTVMLEEIGRDYVRTARAKGLGEGTVLFRHVLKNAMIPILTNAVMIIPFLFMGSLIMESFFSIPGLGSMTIDAINAQDYAVIRSMTYIGAILFILGLLMTDVSYTLVDPRIRLGAGGKRSLYGQPSLADAAKILAGLAVLAGAAVGVYFAARALLRSIWYLPLLRLGVPVVENAALVLTLGGLLAFLLHARRSEMWRRAWGQVRRNRLAMASLGILTVYVLIGVLDSVVWCDQQSAGDRGLRANAAARPLLGPPRSLLDRICVPLSSKKEKTYSAPLAERLLSKETVEEEVNGKVVRRRERPRLKHPRWHFFGGWIDDAVQYLYTTLSSIPWVLLVVAFMMVFGRGLTQLCVVMGITGWVGLCRVLRGETLKLREKEYVQAALALGVSKFRVIAKHIVPNVMHLVLISVVLRFSGLVLAEAGLSYINVGVGPDTSSWGAMINQARSELGREPVVWWSLAGAFLAMFVLVLPANLFGDALRDALDPRLRVRGAGA